MNSGLCKCVIHERYDLIGLVYNGRHYMVQILYCTINEAVHLIPCVYSEKYNTPSGVHIDPQTLYFNTPAQAVNYAFGLGGACA